MYAARLAAEGMAKAIESTSTPGLEDLFPYAHAYHSTYGGDQAANQLVREFLQSLSNAQINRLMASRILSEEEVVSIARNGRLDLSFVDKLRVLGKLIGEPRLIRGLSRLRNDMETAKRLYSDYPVDHMELDGWSKRASAVFKRV
jgi:flavin-dependent dehydrogenase